MKIVVPRAVDRSKYPKSMMYVDGKGNICIAEKREPMSEAEKLKRAGQRQEELNAWRAERDNLADKARKAKKLAHKELSAENAESFEEAKQKYDEFRKAGFHRK